MMKAVCLAVARFRGDKKEAISKNFVNLAEGMAMQGHRVSTFTPTSFETDCPIEQHALNETSRYESLSEAVLNLYRICRETRRQQARFSVFNYHVATPVELLLLHLFLDRETKERTVVSIWQSYLTLGEFRGNFGYFLRNFTKYVHIILLNSFVTAFFYKLLLPKFGKVIVHSEYQQQQLASLSRQRVSLVRNGVLSENAPSQERQDHERFTLLYIGHTKASKGVDFLLEMIALLHKRGNLDFTLVMSLSGFGGEQSLQRLLQDHQLEGRIRFKPEIDIFREMADADLFLLPLRSCVGTSLAPNVIVEALSAGLPIAVPDYPELHGLIQFGVNAIEMDISDMEKSVERIEEAAGNRQFLKSISDNQRQQFRQQLTLEKFVQGYIDELRSTGDRT